MSLKVWLPLNGTLENKGISNVTVTNNGATVNTSGKIGSCYSFSGNSIYGDYTEINNLTQISGCCWAYLTNLNSAQYFMHLGGQASWPCKFSIDYEGSIRFQINGTEYVSGITLTINTWYHITVTWNGSVAKLYVNGVEKSTKTAAGSFSASNHFAIGARTNGTAGNTFAYGISSTGKLNDVRIYDHCLSAAEVKEISQGLVLHYKLDQPYNCFQNKYNDPQNHGYATTMGGGWTRTKLANENGYNYKLTYTGNGNNTWPNLYWPNITFTAGNTYFYSAKVRCNKWTNGTFGFRPARVVNDYTGSHIICASSALTDKQWHEYTAIVTVPESIDRSGTTITCTPHIEFYTSNFNGNDTVYDCDIDIKDVQIVEADIYVPFIDNNFYSNIIEDSSGYGHNGTIVGDLNLISDTPRYMASMNFNGSSAIKYTNFNLGNIWSAGMWFYSSSSVTTTWGALFTVNTSGSDADLKMNLYLQQSSAKIQFSANGQYDTSQTFTKDTWHHLMETFDGSTLSCYLDGKLIKTKAITNAEFTRNNLYVGARSTASNGSSAANYVNAYISDFRIYCTALSADDILQLYHTSAKIDNHQNIHTLEFIENNTTTKLTKQGQFKTITAQEAIYESLAYDQTLYTEPDGSTWIHIFHHNNPAAARFTGSANDWSNGLYIDVDRWYNVEAFLNNTLPYEFMVKQKATSTTTEAKYRWIQTPNPLTATWNDVKPGTVTFITTSGYQNSSFGGMYLMKNGNLHMCIANASNGNWFGGIGASSSYNGGIPGYPNTTITSGYIDLYLRIYPTAKIIKNIGISANTLIER